MAKRGKPTKDRRKAERERKKRWGQQQKNLHIKQLQHDLRYYEENGQMASEERWEETVFQALWDSQNWRNEVEFRELAFEPFATGQAMNRAWQAAPLKISELDSLPEEEREERTFEINAHAINLLLTPEFKKIFLQQLDRFRLRLRAAKRWETLAQVSVMQMALEAAMQTEDDLWPECGLIFQLHFEAVGEYLRLQEAAGDALNTAMQQLGLESDSSVPVFSEEESLQIEAALKQASQQTPGLQEFLAHAADEAVDDALAVIHRGEINCHLFTEQELKLFLVFFLTALKEADAEQADPEDLPAAERAKINARLDESITDFLDHVDTPERHPEFYRDARLALDELCQGPDDDWQTMQANLLRPLLEDDTVPLSENDFFLSAIMGEFGTRMSNESPDDSEDEADTVP